MPDVTDHTPEEAQVLVDRLLAVAAQANVRQGQLQHALDSRVAIEQAKGVLAERLGIGVDEAFDALRRAARSNRMKVHELARAVVAGEETLRL